MQDVYIVSAVRTPLGSFGGMFSSLSAIQLGSAAVKGALKNANVEASKVDEVLFGCVVQANLGQAPAKQVSIAAGISSNVPCTTVNKVCASGMKSVMFGAQGIMLGHNNIVVAGGMESMSNIPFYFPKARWGNKFGDTPLVDGLNKDGLMDAYDHIAMGTFADATATKYNISREEQDAFAIESYKRSASATENGKFKDEIIAVEVPQRKSDPLLISEDEEYKKVKFEKIPALRPAFTKDGTVTAANASTINDGASALILASKKAVDELGLKPIAKIISFADASGSPEWFTTAPTLAAPLALKRAGMELSDMDFFEVNEAFAAVTLAFNKELNVDPSIVNVHGGACSLGHPLGASGARILTTLNHVLRDKDANLGLATLCNGGGGASAIVIERV